MGQTQAIEIPYAPRKQFIPFHERAQRWACMVCHRRSGKTVAFVNESIRGAVTCRHERPRFGYVAPFLKQAKTVAWDYVKLYAGVIPGVQFNEAELRADFPNLGQVRLFGADNIDAMRGGYFDGVILDEFADMPPSIWPVIRPMLADRQGWACLGGTPKGKNELYRVWNTARADDAWFAMMLKASESGLLPESELSDARKLMSENEYAQEFECSFEAAIRGAYYSKELADLEKQGRIGRVPFDPKVQVQTAWDLGIGDSTSIWFAQCVGREVRLIDHYRASGMGLAHYAKVLREKPYTYAPLILPHDADARMQDEEGRTRKEILESLGFRDPTVLNNGPIEDGIEAVRQLLPQCWIDAEKCGPGIEALKQYQREYDERMRDFRPRPRHDWTSHDADALRYLALGLRMPRAGAKPIVSDNRWIV